MTAVVVDTSGPREMTAAHKQALAEGREQSRIVREYLSAVVGNRPKRGRKRTLETVETRLAQIADALVTEQEPLRRLRLAQERMDLEDERERMLATRSSSDLAELEQRFVTVARSYSERKGVSYTAWREAGVTAQVLKEAGIQQTRQR